MNKLSAFLCVAALAAVQMSASVSFAQTYPTKPVRIILPWPPGGSSDVLLRPITIKLTEAWRQQVFIDFRPGASGIIGTGQAARMAPDGYTLLLGSAPLYINPSLYSKLPYDSIKDFAPITQIAAVPNVMAVHPSLPATTVKQLIALASSKPGQVHLGAAGIGSPGHLAGELFKKMAGIDMLTVPYKGATPSIIALLSGEVFVVFTSTGSVLPQAKQGRLRILAVTTRNRVPQLPDTPTIAEAGLRDYEAYSWFGIAAPAGIAPELVSKINADVVKIIKTKDMQDVIFRLGAVAIANTSEQFRIQLRQDIEKWAMVVKAAGVEIRKID